MYIYCVLLRQEPLKEFKGVTFFLLKLLGRQTLHCHLVTIETLWNLLETTLALLLCEKVAISTLVPGEVAVMDTFFSILLPGCRRTILGERERERVKRNVIFSNFASSNNTQGIFMDDNYRGQLARYLMFHSREWS